jgi:glutathione S-transferase
MQLVTIPFSHFCEKGRWALDRTGARYRELQFAPGLHRVAVMPLGSATSPVLVDAPRIISGTNEIVQFCDERVAESDRLLPADPVERAEVEALVKRFDEVLAPQVRLWLYSWATENSRRLYDFSVAGIPRAQRPIMKTCLPVISKALAMYFELGPETHVRAVEIITQEFDFVSELISDRREYLVGDRFSAADLAFAAFVGSVVGAPEYGGTKYTPPPRPGDLAPQALEWQETAAGEWVRGIYRTHRMAGSHAATLAIL